MSLFYDAGTAASILALSPDYIVDAIDNITAARHLLATARRLNKPIVKRDWRLRPAGSDAVRVADLADTRIDPLAQEVWHIRVASTTFPATALSGIPAVFFDRAPAANPQELHDDGGERALPASVPAARTMTTPAEWSAA